MGTSEQAAQAALDALGFGRRYVTLAEAWPTGTPAPEGDGDPWGYTVTTAVTQFPLAEDASAAFALIETGAEAGGALVHLERRTCRSIR